MRLLILGGTRFLGRHLTAAAIAAGHEVTLLHRGETAPDLFPEVTHLKADRRVGVSWPEGATWDAAVDVWASHPSLVRDAATALRERVDHFVYVSSVSAYLRHEESGCDENGALHETEGVDLENDSPETYGARKVACEAEAIRAFPAASWVIRPGLIVGPHDSSDRFSYWPRRLARGGPVLAPGSPDAPVQWIDVRDLADWMVRGLEERLTGVFNAVGPGQPATMREFLAGCAAGIGAEPELRWVEDAALLEAGAVPWTGIPLWIPASFGGFHRTSHARAVAAGLTFRSLEETTRDTLEWDRERGSPPMPTTLSREAEDSLLAG